MSRFLCPWCECPRTGLERLCLGCSRTLPQVAEAEVKELAFSGDGQEVVAPALNRMAVEGAVTRLGEAFLAGNIEASAFLAKLEWLELALLNMVAEKSAILKKGRQVFRQASPEELEQLLEFEEQARTLLEEMQGLFQDCTAALAELVENQDRALVEEAVQHGGQAMELVESFEELCDEFARNLELS